MSEHNVDRIIEKVKKCLALSASSNSNEAAIALKQAKQLMQKYELSDLDISLSSVGESASNIPQNTSPPGYLVNLADLISSVMGCEMFLSPRVNGGRLIFIGVAPNDQLASYAFDTLSRSLKIARSEYIKLKLKRLRVRKNKTKRADLFCQGWVSAVNREVAKLKVAPPSVVDKYISVKYPKLVEKECRKQTIGANHRDINDYSNGYIKGKDVNLSRPLGGGKSTELLK